MQTTQCHLGATARLRDSVLGPWTETLGPPDRPRGWGRVLEPPARTAGRIATAHGRPIARASFITNPGSVRCCFFDAAARHVTKMMHTVAGQDMRGALQSLMQVSCDQALAPHTIDQLHKDGFWVVLGYQTGRTGT